MDPWHTALERLETPWFRFTALRWQFTPFWWLRRLVPNPAGSPWIILPFQVFPMLSHIFCFGQLSNLTSKVHVLLISAVFDWRAKCQSTQKQEVSDACWAARALEMSCSGFFSMWQKMRFFDASQHLWTTHFSKRRNNGHIKSLAFWLKRKEGLWIGRSLAVDAGQNLRARGPQILVYHVVMTNSLPWKITIFNR